MMKNELSRILIHPKYPASHFITTGPDRVNVS